MNIHEFEKHCMDHSQSRQGEDYILGQIRRLHKVYKLICDRLNHGDTLLSVGAGASYVETALIKSLDLNVYVADFPRALKAHDELYKKYDMQTMGCDLTEESPIPGDFEADMVLSAEVLEHLNEPPKSHIQKISYGLGSSGELLLTTPNLARLRIIALLILGKSYLAEPGEFFSETSYENEGVHRREYVMSETKDAVIKNNLDIIETGYLFKGSHKWRKKELWLLYPFEKVVPRFRPIQYILAQA